MENLEQLKKMFIMDSHVEQEKIKDLIQRLSQFCKVDTNGYVFISDKTLIQKLTIKNKILLALSARYLASILHETISADVSGDELAKFFSDKIMALQARAKELKDEGKIIVKERGKYSINPFQIDDFIKSLEMR